MGEGREEGDARHGLWHWRSIGAPHSCHQLQRLRHASAVEHSGGLLTPPLFTRTTDAGERALRWRRPGDRQFLSVALSSPLLVGRHCRPVPTSQTFSIPSTAPYLPYLADRSPSKRSRGAKEGRAHTHHGIVFFTPLLGRPRRPPAPPDGQNNTDVVGPTN